MQKFKKIIITLIVAIVVIIMSIVLRPLFVGGVLSASTPYVATDLMNASHTVTITPASFVTTSIADTFYTLWIFIEIIAALVVLVLEAVDKI